MSKQWYKFFISDSYALYLQYSEKIGKNGVCLVPSHYLNQYWLIVNWALGNKFQCHFNQSEENEFENVVCKMVVLFWPQCVENFAFEKVARKTLLWRHNERDSVSNHQRLYCLLKRLFRRRSKITSKLRVTGLCARNSPGTGEFPAQKASNAENVFIWWRHHDICHLFQCVKKPW